MTSLPELCLRRPVATTTCALAAVVLGVVSLARLPLEYLPEIQGRSLTITASYPASSPQEVERIIARPLEEELASLEGLESLGSTSRASGATVRLELKADTDIYVVVGAGHFSGKMGIISLLEGKGYKVRQMRH